MSADPILEMSPLGDFQSNAFLVRHQDDPKACWIVDCGPDPQPLIDAMHRHGVRPVGIVLTHCHHDHIGGIDQVLSEFGPMPIAAHVLEKDWNSEPMLNLSHFLGAPQTATPPDLLLEEDDPCPLGPEWRMLHLPGHSPGSLGFLHEPSGTLIAGDTLFAGSIGRIDFPTSDPDAMRATLSRLLELPDEVRICPGHGGATTIGHERSSNPFLRGGTPAI